DIKNLNMDGDCDKEIGSNEIPDIVLVKKKYNRSKKRIWKLKHIEKETEMDVDGEKREKNNRKNKKGKDLDDAEEVRR
ncbi:hypothetical protein NPN18_26905, partial [Vibrio parahaemolyticus]|nr:hypothetical protein [Vibrio parahaemolyticus]